MRKKIDSRIKILIENAQKLRQRGIFVIIGDRGKDQVKIIFNLGCKPLLYDVTKHE